MQRCWVYERIKKNDATHFVPRKAVLCISVPRKWISKPPLFLLFSARVCAFLFYVYVCNCVKKRAISAHATERKIVVVLTEKKDLADNKSL